MEFEKVDAILRRGREVRIGDKLQCSCIYEVVRLNPVWSSIDGKHMSDHNHNGFDCKLVEFNNCVFHRKCECEECKKL